MCNGDERSAATYGAVELSAGRDFPPNCLAQEAQASAPLRRVLLRKTATQLRIAANQTSRVRRAVSRRNPLPHGGRFDLVRLWCCFCGVAPCSSRATFEQIIQGTAYISVRAMNKTTYEKDRYEGKAAERLNLLRPLLEEKFGALPPEIRERLQNLPIDHVRQLILALSSAKTLDELGLG